MIKVTSGGAREALGWVGVVLVLGAYFFATIGQLDAQSWLFQVANLVGAVFLISSSLKHHDWQPVAVNTVWALIAIVGIVALYI